MVQSTMVDMILLGKILGPLPNTCRIEEEAKICIEELLDSGFGIEPCHG